MFDEIIFEVVRFDKERVLKALHYLNTEAFPAVFDSGIPEVSADFSMEDSGHLIFRVSIADGGPFRDEAYDYAACFLE